MYCGIVNNRMHNTLLVIASRKRSICAAFGSLHLYCDALQYGAPWAELTLAREWTVYFVLIYIIYRFIDT